MNVHPQTGGQRRGACPGLSAPMATGDGLLVRLSPLGTLTPDAFDALCEAAQRHGNGIVEITARGNIQVRGLSAVTAPEFAAAVAALAIAAEDGVPIVCNPLAGLDPKELIDASMVAAQLRRALAQTPLAAQLSPKVSVVIDGGGAYRLGELAADFRARAIGNNNSTSLAVEAAGHSLGAIAPSNAVAALLRLLGVVAKHSRETRARDVIAAEGIGIFHAAIADFLISADAKEKNDEPQSLGAWRLRDGTFARSLALPFGHADAASLQQLTAAARAAGASGFRTAPGRIVLALGLPQQKLQAFAATAANLGFIADAADPRRHVVACAGAPICGAAYIAARALGPEIAAAAAPYLGGKFRIHISGCSKGCAHPPAAALTVVGTAAGCALVADGTARDTPFMTVSATELVETVVETARRRSSGAPHG